jgi:hypothetical protein
LFARSTKFRFNHRPSTSGSAQGKRAPDQHLDIKRVECTAAFVSDSTKISDSTKKSATGHSRDHASV